MLGDLDQVADDGLLVPALGRARVDRRGHFRRIGVDVVPRATPGSLATPLAAAAAAAVPAALIHDHRRLREREPELRATRYRTRAALLLTLFIADELQPLVRLPVQRDVPPVGGDTRRRGQRLLPQLFRIAREAREERRQLVERESVREAEPGEPVPMQPLREATQMRVARIGGVAVDHELIPRHSHRHGIDVGEQWCNPLDQTLLRGRQCRMPAGIHRTPLQRHRELDEKIRELFGQRWRSACRRTRDRRTDCVGQGVRAIGFGPDA